MNLYKTLLVLGVCLTTAALAAATKDEFDLLLALLPIYGKVKIKSVTTQRTLNLIKVIIL